MQTINFDDINISIPEPINTKYDEIVKYCNFKTELIQPSGSVIPPYEGISPNIDNSSNYEPISIKKSEELYNLLVDEL
jgi:hypothetical protein